MGNKLNNSHIVADNIISALGFTTNENIAAIEARKIGVSYDYSQEIAGFPVQAALIDKQRFEKLILENYLTKYNRIEQLAILSIKNILSQMQTDLKSKDTAFILSTTKGNVDLLSGNKLSKDVYLWHTAQNIASYFEMCNEPIIISNACISGVSALLVAHRLIYKGKYKQIIITGVDVLSHFIASGFQSFHSLSENVCKPFDANRDGLSLGEACGSILLSSEPTKDSIVIRGGAISNDANHISGPSRDGGGLHQAIAEALSKANIQTNDVDFINLHGTATVYNDEMEAKALKSAGLQEVPVNSLKPYFGHTLGASGIIESIVCTYQLKNNIVFGTPRYNECGTSVPLKVSEENQILRDAVTCIKTASGFGGCNATIVLSKSESPKAIERNMFTIKDIRHCVVEKNAIYIDNKKYIEKQSPDFSSFIRYAFKELNMSNPKFYKMDDLCKLGYTAAFCLLNNENINPDKTGIILANSVSSLNTDIKHQAIIDKDGDLAASPSCFVYTLPNIVAGEICIQYGLRGENTFFIRKEYDEQKLRNYVKIAMWENNMDNCIYGWCNLLGQEYKADFRLIQKLN